MFTFRFFFYYLFFFFYVSPTGSPFFLNFLERVDVILLYTHVIYNISILSYKRTTRGKEMKRTHPRSIHYLKKKKKLFPSEDTIVWCVAKRRKGNKERKKRGKEENKRTGSNRNAGARALIEFFFLFFKLFGFFFRVSWWKLEIIYSLSG